MKRVVAGWGVFLTSFFGGSAYAQGSGAAPPTAQFPTTDAAPVPSAKPATPLPTASSAPAAPLPAPAPPPPPSAELPPDDPSTRPAQPHVNDSDEIVSLTFSPLHLISPILEITGEVRVTPHLGVSVIGGYGKMSVDSFGSSGTDKVKLSVYELGGQLSVYPLKQFKSLQLGAEVLYLKINTDGLFPGTNISGTAAGVALGPFVGYKLVTDAGFTFLAQGGFEYIAAHGEAKDSSGNSGADNEKSLIPLLNLNIGWSF